MTSAKTLESSAVRLCKNEKCVQPVPPSKNPGVERLYCRPACRTQTNNRAYYNRQGGGASGDGMLKEDTASGKPFVSRIKASNAKAAETRFKRHLNECAISDDAARRCPARFDAYDTKRLCLIHAVLREDWDQVRRAKAGRKWERERTTETGYWIEDDPSSS